MMAARGQITIKRETVGQVKHFKYLGSIIESDGNEKIDINERTKKAMKMYHRYS